MSLTPEGQDAALAALRALAARGDDAPRTLLLAGPDGVGRRDVARWYAALRGCAANLDDPCGRCPACRSLLPDPDGVVDGPDYREVGPATTTRDGKPARRPQLRIDQLVPRERSDVDDPLGPWLARPPVFRHRVGTIVRAETLTEEAANAFLTTLETPPRHATLVLIAPGPDALLPTVASRCAVVRLDAGRGTGRRPGAARAASGAAAGPAGGLARGAGGRGGDEREARRGGRLPRGARRRSRRRLRGGRRARGRVAQPATPRCPGSCARRGAPRDRPRTCGATPPRRPSRKRGARTRTATWRCAGGC